jgi:hypothetical protein
VVVALANRTRDWDALVAQFGPWVTIHAALMLVWYAGAAPGRPGPLTYSPVRDGEQSASPTPVPDDERLEKPRLARPLGTPARSFVIHVRRRIPL